jgi:hypothetical protein
MRSLPTDQAAADTFRADALIADHDRSLASLSSSSEYSVNRFCSSLKP